MTSFVSDWLVLTPLNEEWTQLTEAIPVDRDDRWDDEIPRTSRWRISITRRPPVLASGTYLGVRTPGQAVSGVQAARLISALRPRSVALIGIAGAFDPRLALGDVVVPDLIFGYTTGAVDDAPFGPKHVVRRATVTVSGPLVRAAQDFVNGTGYRKWQEAGRRQAKQLGLTLPDDSPRAHMQIVLASGNEVVRSTVFADDLKTMLDDRISCVAMEEVGCSEAIDGLDARSSLLVIRGVSDRADSQKQQLEASSKDAWRKLAAGNAARLWHMIVQDHAETSVQRELLPELVRAPAHEVDRVFPQFVTRRPGLQHLGFVDVLQLYDNRPPMRIAVTTTAIGTLASRAKISNKDRSIEVQLKRTDFGLECDIPPACEGALSLALHADPALQRIEVRFEDYFGRVAVASLDLEPAARTTPPAPDRGPSEPPHLGAVLPSTRWRVNLEGTLNDLTAIDLQRLLNALREVSDDATLSIISVAAGSIDVFCETSRNLRDAFQDRHAAMARYGYRVSKALMERTTPPPMPDRVIDCLEQELRMPSPHYGGDDNGKTSVESRVAQLVERGELSTDLADAVRAGLKRQPGDVWASVSLASEVRSSRLAFILENDFAHHIIWRTGTRNTKEDIFAALAVTSPDFDYEFHVLDRAIREFNKREKERFPAEPLRVPVISLPEFVEVLEFRERELDRVREGRSHDTTRDGDWRWPQAWGDIHFSSGVGPGHILNRDPREDKERLERALRRYRALSGTSPESEETLEQRLERLNEAVRRVEVQDAQGRARVLKLSGSLAEECKRARISCETTEFVLSEVGDERVYGSVGVNAEGLHIAYRSTSDDLDDSLNKIPMPWGYSVMEPAKWPIEWLRVVLLEHKLDEIVSILLQRVRQLAPHASPTDGSASDSDASTQAPIVNEVSSKQVLRDGEDRETPARPPTPASPLNRASSRASGITDEKTHVRCDVGILTIKDEEFEAVLDAFPNDPALYAGPKSQRHYNLRTADAGQGTSYRIAIVRHVEQGTGDAQSTARDMIEELDPTLILVVGIAGARPTVDFTLGDVILSMRVHDYTVHASSPGKDDTYAVAGGPIASEIQKGVANLKARQADLSDWAEGLPPRPTVTPDAIRVRGATEWQDEIRASILHHFRTAPRESPIYRAGALGSSDGLIKDPEVLIAWLRTARDLLAVEMEAAGVYRAARDRCAMLAIRGISDIVGLDRDERWTKYAARSAAAFARAYLKTTPVTPTSLKHVGARTKPTKARAIGRPTPSGAAPPRSATTDEPPVAGIFGVHLNRERQETLDLVYNELVSRDAWPDALSIAQHLLEKNRVELREAMLNAGWLFPVDDLAGLNGHIRLRFAALCLVSNETARGDTTYVLRAVRAIGRLASRHLKTPVNRSDIAEEMGDELSAHRFLLLEATLTGLGFSVEQSADATVAWSIPWSDRLMPLALVEQADALLTRMFGLGVAEFQARHYGATRPQIPAVSARDRGLLVDLNNVLPYTGSIRFIKDNNLAGFAFDISHLRDLQVFDREWSDAAHRFQHPLLERARRVLQSLVDDYLKYIALWTFPVDGPRELFTVPPEWEEEQPTRFRWVVDELHRIAGEIVHCHQELVALGTALIPSDPPTKRRTPRPRRKSEK